MQAIHKKKCPGGAGHFQNETSHIPHRAADWIIAGTEVDYNLRANSRARNVTLKTEYAAGLTPVEIREKAEVWFQRQCVISQKAFGDRWLSLQDWVESYLRQELRERLIARGWRVKA